MDEFGIIARFFAPLAKDPGALGLKDDAAFIHARPGFDLVVTTDQIAEGTDFLSSAPAAHVAKKALRVNLSDLAAKGASPAYYLLNLALPHATGEEWLAQFTSGLLDDQEKFGIALLGGDLSATDGPLSVSVTAMGFVPAGCMVRRAGAKIGDAVYVTGTIGDSEGGLAILRGEMTALEQAQQNHLVGRYRVPEPPVLFGTRLGSLANAAIDISDGLVADLGHLASSSGVQIALEAEDIPRSESLTALWGNGPDAIIRAATAGDDYQIAFAAHPGREADIRAAAAQTQTRVTRIGAVSPGKHVVLTYQGQLLSLAKEGYRHF